MKRLRRFARRHWRATTAYALLSLALGPVSLLGGVHVEAAAVVSAVAFFVSGPAAVAAFRRKERSFARALAAQEALLLVPLLLLTVTALWRPQCDYARGLLLFAVMPPVTVAFAVGGAYALTGAGVRHSRATLSAGRSTTWGCTRSFTPTTTSSAASSAPSTTVSWRCAPACLRTVRSRSSGPCCSGAPEKWRARMKERTLRNETR
ncbi:MAG: hypothetical protein BRD40_01950 [Bacteroidetes bacterium QS_1_65_9]|nr:MAG: hypothetical protein BRD40_01950 [Bacteroidetes bacterium QS_1_65_9]